MSIERHGLRIPARERIERLKAAVGFVKNKVAPAIGKVFPKLADTVVRCCDKVENFVEKHETTIEKVLDVVTPPIVKAAEDLGLKKQNVDPPEEMAMKAEAEGNMGVTRAMFESAQEYIQHLHDEVELPAEARENFDQKEPEEQAAYRVVGNGIYIAGIAEKTQINEAAFEPGILMDFYKLELGTEQVLRILTALRDAGVNDGVIFSNYLHGGAVSAENQVKIRSAMVKLEKDENPDRSDEQLKAAADERIQTMRERLG